jgi:hypothetical protein
MMASLEDVPFRRLSRLLAFAFIYPSFFSS